MKIENYILIILDGIDGVGKSTQTQLLLTQIGRHGYAVETLDFPLYNGTFFGTMVGRFLKGEFGGIKDVDPRLASILYALDRFEMKKTLTRWLRQKKIIILDRYTTSNLIHQGSKLSSKKRAAFAEWVEEMEYEVLGLPRPDIVIYLALPYRLACALIKKRGDKKDIHEKDLEYLRNTARYGLQLAREKGWHVIQCNRGNNVRTKEEIAKEMWKFIRMKLKTQNSNLKTKT